MTEKTKSKTTFKWQRVHSLEARLRLWVGQTRAEIARALGCSRWTVSDHAKREDLGAQMGRGEAGRVLAELRAMKAVAELLAAEAGSAAQARLLGECQRLLCDDEEGEGDIEEFETESERDAREARMAALVGRLGRPAPDGEDGRANVALSVPVSVSGAGAGEPEAARGELADMDVHGRTRGRQDAGGGGVGTVRDCGGGQADRAGRADAGRCARGDDRGGVGHPPSGPTQGRPPDL